MYEQASTTELEQRLSTLAKLLWAARTREYLRIYEDVTGDYSRGDVPLMTVRDQAWQAERDNLEVQGTSSGGHVAVRATGLRGWQVRLSVDCKRQLDERQFAEAVSEAAGAFINDQYMKIAELSNRHYGDESWVGGS